MTSPAITWTPPLEPPWSWKPLSRGCHHVLSHASEPSVRQSGRPARPVRSSPRARSAWPHGSRPLRTLRVEHPDCADHSWIDGDTHAGCLMSRGSFHVDARASVVARVEALPNHVPPATHPWRPASIPDEPDRRAVTTSPVVGLATPLRTLPRCPRERASSPPRLHRAARSLDSAAGPVATARPGSRSSQRTPRQESSWRSGTSRARGLARSSYVVRQEIASTEHFALLRQRGRPAAVAVTAPGWSTSTGRCHSRQGRARRLMTTSSSSASSARRRRGSGLDATRPQPQTA